MFVKILATKFFNSRRQCLEIFTIPLSTEQNSLLKTSEFSIMYNTCQEKNARLYLLDIRYIQGRSEVRRRVHFKSSLSQLWCLGPCQMTCTGVSS